MTQPIELVLADVDGTLVTKAKLLTPAAIDAARRLEAAGIRLAVTSGRPPRGMTSVIKGLGLKTPVAAFNGGAFVTPALEPVKTHGLDASVLPVTLEVFKANGVDLWVYAGDAWLLRDPGAPHVAHEAETVGFAPVVAADLVAAAAAAGGPVIKIVGVSDEPERLARCEAALEQRCGQSVSATCSQPYYLDVTHADANKGAVVDFLADFFKIPRERIATIGDGHNDVLMFRRSGLSIAMGNAAPEVKQAATYVTASNEEDGFAKAILEHVLPAGGRPV